MTKVGWDRPVCIPAHIIHLSWVQPLLFEQERLKTGGKKMRLFMGQCGCYKSSALQERGEAIWRVRTWSGGKTHDYWVENGQFYAIGETGDSSVARAEREAVLNMIAKWEADQLSDNAFQAAA